MTRAYIEFTYTTVRNSFTLVDEFNVNLTIVISVISSLLCNGEVGYPSRHKTLNQCWFNVGSTL